MNRSIQLLALFTTVNAIALLPPASAVAKPDKLHRYNPALVALYTSRCTKRLRANKTPKAKQACQCSVREMQKRYPQRQAIAIIKKAKSSDSMDPSTGVPTLMSKYFSPCL